MSLRCPPYKIVSPMRGKKSADRDADQRVGRHDVLLRRQDVRAALEQRRRQPGRDVRWTRLLGRDRRRARSHPGGGRAECSIWFSLATICRSTSGIVAAASASAASAREVASLFPTPPTQLSREQVERPLERVARALGDLELEIELAELEVGLRDVGDER